MPTSHQNQRRYSAEARLRSEKAIQQLRMLESVLYYLVAQKQVSISAKDLPLRKMGIKKKDFLPWLSSMEDFTDAKALRSFVLNSNQLVKWAEEGLAHEIDSGRRYDEAKIKEAKEAETEKKKQDRKRKREVATTLKKYGLTMKPSHP
jgi:hypothetical protein